MPARRCASIRERLRQLRQRLRHTLEQFARGRDTAKYLQDDVVTERNGRFVLLVRAEHRGSVPGIVHGSSASGASLFLEPAATVEINNDIVELEEREREEIFRILLALTDRFRHRPGDFAVIQAVAVELDVLQARARHSTQVAGIEPTFVADRSLELRGARHPLLEKAVPIDVVLDPPSRVLLITGPNTGGKTVALKTAGLFALMAQSGLHIPAHDRTAAGVPLGLRRHRRRAVDRGQPEHLLGPHHQPGGDGPRAAAAGAGPARRGGNRHRPERGRRAGHGARRITSGSAART